jgi:hypothetical protein
MVELLDKRQEHLPHRNALRVALSHVGLQLGRKRRQRSLVNELMNVNKWQHELRTNINALALRRFEPDTFLAPAR